MLRALIPALLCTAPITLMLSAAPAAAAPGPLLAALAGDSGAAPASAGTRVEIESSGNTKLVGSYFEPKKKGQLAPAALLIHDAGAGRGQLEDLAKRLQRLGFGVLTLDLRGHGDSAGAKEWSGLDRDAKNGLWAFATRDVDAGARWLLSRPEIHGTNLSLLGVGAGAALAVRHAKEDENVRCVALVEPRFDAFGFDVKADLIQIAGVTTYVVTSRDGREECEHAVEEVNALGHPYVELMVAASPAVGLLEDPKTALRVTTWIRDTVAPKKGRG